VEQVPALGFLYLAIKIIIGLIMMIWIRASWPRFRYDQLMGFGWKRLLPIIVLNFIITGVYFVLLDAGALPPFVESLHQFFAG
jgi:NADH-quinone oxidoreductase subunit H